MTKVIRISAVLAMLMAAACVTVNIYFPAAEVKKDAQRVVKEVYGIEEGGAAEEPQEGSSLDLFDLIGPGEAYAQDYQSLSNSVTRGIEQQLAQNHQQLAPFYSAGNVGLDSQGFAALRDKGGLNMQQVGQLNRLVSNDRQLKMQLYQEKAKAAQNPNKVGEVQRIYQDLWKNYAGGGTYIQSGGGWTQK